MIMEDETILDDSKEAWVSSSVFPVGSGNLFLYILRFYLDSGMSIERIQNIDVQYIKGKGNRNDFYAVGGSFF